MGEARKQFTFYRSYYEALLPLPRENQAAILLAVCAYALYEAEPQDLTPVESAAFNLIRPTLDTARKKAQGGKQGGEANRKQSGSKVEASWKHSESIVEAKRKHSGSEGEGEKEKEKEGEKEIEGEYENEIEKESYNPLHPPSRLLIACRPSVVRAWDRITYQYPNGHVYDWDKAEEAYRDAVRTDNDAREILDSLNQWLHSEQWTKADGQYIPQLANWISRGTWRTRPAKMATPKGASGLGLAEMEAIWQQLDPEDAAKARSEWMRTGGGSYA